MLDQVFSSKINVIHHAPITLSDGVTLSAMLWLPASADEKTVPAILEYLPYRKRDGTSERDALNHPYFAAHGYASVRVDMRGSGDSEGVLHGEYLKQEQDDGLEILQWIAEQPWCSGSIGMIGISWGGFNGLQMAARRPPELKAVVSICSTDDRYADDIHSMGGCLLVDKFSWGSTMFSINATPPDPELVGDQWRDLWLGRLEKSGFWIEEWHRHQRRDEFFKQGSVCEDYSAIECPVYLVGGWADGYTNPIFRMLENLNSPCKALIGPWAHKYPNFALPGPRIGFLQECLRWWDYWLKDKETGIMDEPQVRAWMQDTAAPKPMHAERQGRWIAEGQWPSPEILPRFYPLGKNRIEFPDNEISDNKIEEEWLNICSPQTVGLAGGKWCPYGLIPDQPGDQRQEAGGSLVFDTQPLEQTLEFFGAPIAHLSIKADKPEAQVAVTLSEVLADGAVTRLSYGLLNLTHREGHEHLQELVPNQSYQVKIKLNDCAQSLSPGSRLRLAVSSTYWPIIWPSPETTQLSIQTGLSRLELPVRSSSAIDKTLKEFGPAENAPDLNASQLKPKDSRYQITQDLETSRVTLEIFGDDGLIQNNDTGWMYGSSCQKLFSILPDDPLSATCDIHWVKAFERENWRVSIKADTHMEVTRTHYLINASLEAFEDDESIFFNEWNCEIQRDHN